MKTAVEFLLDELHGFIHPEHGKDFLPILEQAKQMEKENIKRDVYELCKLILSNPIETSGKTPKELFEQYYNETYKNTNE